MGITLESCGVVKVNSLTENIRAGLKKKQCVAIIIKSLKHNFTNES